MWVSVPVPRLCHGQNEDELMNEPTRKMRQLAQLNYGLPWHTAMHREAYAAGMLKAMKMIVSRVAKDGTAGGTAVVLYSIQNEVGEVDDRC